MALAPKEPCEKCQGETAVVAYIITGGQKQYRNYCHECDHLSLQSLKTADAIAAEPNPSEIHKIERDEQQRLKYEALSSERQTEWENKREKYNEYITSAEWDRVRRSTYRRDSYRCVLCHANNCTLHAHHMTYARLYNEDPRDLITVCPDCHSHIHGRIVGEFNAPV